MFELNRMVFPINLQLFAEDQNPGNPGGQGGAAGGGAGGSSPFAVFPDEASFNARLKREGRSQLETKAKEFGFETVEALEAAIKAAKEKDEANKSETQKLQEKLQQAEAARQSAYTLANERLVKAEIKEQSAALGLVDADAAFALMDRSAVKVDDKGNVAGVKEALDALIKAKPYLKATPAGTKIGGGSNPAGGAGGGQANPWKKETFNLTMQGKIMQENPALAESLKAEAKSK